MNQKIIAALFIGLAVPAAIAPADSAQSDRSESALSAEDYGEHAINIAKGEGVIAIRSDSLEYSCRWPIASQYLSIEKTADLQNSCLDTLIQNIESAKQAQQLAVNDNRSFYPYFFAIDWQLLTDQQRLSSLLFSIEQYTGGAHPNRNFGGLIWDNQREAQLSLDDLFVENTDLDHLLHRHWCKNLLIEQAIRREQTPPSIMDDAQLLPQCSDIKEDIDILPQPSNKGASRQGSGGRADQFGIYIAPYIAGPYAEGSYILKIPIDAEILAAIRPECAQAFSLAPKIPIRK